VLENCVAWAGMTGYIAMNTTLRGCAARACQGGGFRVTSSLLVNNNAKFCGNLSDIDPTGGGFALNEVCVAEGNTSMHCTRGFVVSGIGNVLIRNRVIKSSIGHWDIAAGNVVAPIIQAGTNGAPIAGESYVGSYDTTHPDANITH
jgi:hypothetical protein